jgi:hypothetical protein
MAVGAPVLLLAVGAVLTLAGGVALSSTPLVLVGLILMVTGGVGVIASLLWSASWSRRRREMLITREPY